MIPFLNQFAEPYTEGYMVYFGGMSSFLFSLHEEVHADPPPLDVVTEHQGVAAEHDEHRSQFLCSNGQPA